MEGCEEGDAIVEAAGVGDNAGALLETVLLLVVLIINFGVATPPKRKNFLPHCPLVMFGLTIN